MNCPDFTSIFGCDIYIVGGAVRDYLLGIQGSDVDIASSLRPEEFISLCRKKGFKVIPTGIEHGTVTVLIKGEAYEHTTFRHDVSCDGRNATITFSNCIKEDLARRDFTINAIAIKGEDIIDPFGGYDDLMKNRILRTVGKAEERFSEDYLRIVRAARFAARFEFPLHEDLLNAARLHGRDIMKFVSIERISDEIRKSRKFAHRFFELAEEMHFIDEIIPEHGALKNSEKKKWLADLTLAGSEFSEDIYWAALFVPLCQSKKSLEKLARSFRLSNHALRCITDLHLLENFYRDQKSISLFDFLKIVRQIRSNCRELLVFIERKQLINNDLLHMSLSFLERCQETLDKPFISGVELKEMGLNPGPKFKIYIDKALELQLSGKNKEEIIYHLSREIMI